MTLINNTANLTRSRSRPVPSRSHPDPPHRRGHAGSQPLSGEPPTPKPADPPIRKTSGRKAYHGRLQRRAFEYADKLVHEVVARMLLIVAIIVLVDTTRTFLTHNPFSANAAMAAVSSVLFAVIIVEIMRTIHTRFDKGVRQLQTFMVLGIISAVREVLAISARLSFDSTGAAANTHTALLLGANAAVVVGLTTSLILIRRLGGVAPLQPR